MSAEGAELQVSAGPPLVETLCLRRTQVTDIEGSIMNNGMLKVSVV